MTEEGGKVSLIPVACTCVSFIGYFREGYEKERFDIDNSMVSILNQQHGQPISLRIQQVNRVDATGLLMFKKLQCLLTRRRPNCRLIVTNIEDSVLMDMLLGTGVNLYSSLTREQS